MGRISFAALRVLRDDLVLEFVHHSFALKIPDFDGWASGGAQPVAVRRETQSIDNVGVVKCVQSLVVIQIPQHSFAVLKD